MNNFKKIGKLIRKYRVDAGLTQLELGLKIGYNQPMFLSLIETGKAKVPLQKLGLIAGYLDIPENEILDSLLKDFIQEVKSTFEKERTNSGNSEIKPKDKYKESPINKNKNTYTIAQVKVIVRNIKNEHARRIRELIKENEEMKTKLGIA